MTKLRKGEAKFYKTMNPTELGEYLKEFSENREYVRHFQEKYKYNWVSKEWKKGK